MVRCPAVCRWAPGLLLASYGGVLADRYERVTVMMMARVGQRGADDRDWPARVATDAPIGFVLALAALSAVPLAPYQPAAGRPDPESLGRRTWPPPTRSSPRCRTWWSACPGIGGLLRLTSGSVIGVVANAASFAVAAALVSRLRVRSRGGGEAEGGTWQQLTAGLKALAAQPVAVAVILFSALDSAVYGASTVLYVPLSVRLGTGAEGYGYLLAGRRSAGCSARAWRTG